MADQAFTRPLSEEEKAKFVAEARKAEAEAAKAAAETRKLLADAEAFEHEAIASKIRLERLCEDESMRILSDHHQRVYRFHGVVDASSTTKCISTLALWDRLDPTCNIEIVFNSPGGSVIDGMALFDQISAFSLRGGGTHKVTIGTRGYAASMAGILLQAGDHRWIGKQSFLMIHEISANTGGKIGDIQDTVKLFESMCERVVNIFVERSGGKCSKARFLKGWTRTDWWIVSEDALKLGFVDEVR